MPTPRWAAAATDAAGAAACRALDDAATTAPTRGPDAGPTRPDATADASRQPPRVVNANAELAPGPPAFQERKFSETADALQRAWLCVLTESAIPL